MPSTKVLCIKYRAHHHHLFCRICAGIWPRAADSAKPAAKNGAASSRPEKRGGASPAALSQSSFVAEAGSETGARAIELACAKLFVDIVGEPHRLLGGITTAPQ